MKWSEGALKIYALEPLHSLFEWNSETGHLERYVSLPNFLKRLEF